MAEKAEKKPEAAPPAAAGDKKEATAKKGGGAAALLAKTPILLGIIMVIEAVVLFAGFKFLGGGAKHAAAADESAQHEEGGHGDEHGGKPSTAPLEKNKIAYVPVVDSFRASNKVSGRTLLFEFSLCGVVKGDNEEKVKTKVKDREALIRDRVRTIIAQSDPEKLSGGSEPGLETLRRQVKYQLDEIVGEGMIEEVLVTKSTTFRADY